MSPVRPSGRESLQEMIDRYNRELLRMHANVREDKAEPPQTRPGTPTRPRPEPEEPLYNRGSGMPRPEPSGLNEEREPRTPPHSQSIRDREQSMRDIGQGMRDREQGMRDIGQGMRDREQGMRDIGQSIRDREQGMRDIGQSIRDREQGMRDIGQSIRDREQGMRDIGQSMRDREQGMRDIGQGMRDREQGLRDIGQGRKDAQQRTHAGTQDLERELERLKNALKELELRHAAPPAAPSARTASAAQPESEWEQWMRDLEQGRKELEQGLRDLEQGWRDRQQGVRDYEQGIADAEYSPAQSRQAINLPPAENSGTADSFGTLIVQVYTARRAEPVAGAQVAVTLPGEEGEVLYRVMHTDDDGRTPPLRLPVDAPQQSGYTAPSVNYMVYVTADKFLPSEGLAAQIFSGITGILPVELIPGEEGF